MPRRNTLNGIPHNVTKSFFGTERYFHKGYMGDWILNVARQLRVDKASLDILNARFQPEEFNIYPLLVHAQSLRSIIEKELVANGFTSDYIVTANIDMIFPDPHKYRTTIYCFPYIIDKDGREYAPGKIIENGFEDEFDALDKKLQCPADPFNVSLEKILPIPWWRWRILKRRMRIVINSLLGR